MSELIQDRAIGLLTMVDQQKVVCISNGAIFSDLEQSPTQFSKSRSRHSLTLNISQRANELSIVAITNTYETIPKLSNGTIFNDSSDA